MASHTQLNVDSYRLQQFIRWDILASALGTLFVGGCFLYTYHQGLSILFIATVMNTAALFLSLHLAKQERIDAAIFVMCGVLWVLLIVAIYIAPTFFPGIALLAIWPVAISVPYLRRASLKRLMILSNTVGITMALLSIRSDPFNVSASLPPGVLEGSIVVCAAGFTALTLLQLWQYSGRLNDTLDQMQAANEALQESERSLEEKVSLRTQALEDKNQTLADTLQKLRDMQNQLIVQEKLASLGALTAGIAHEIQNPLNFVNNLAQLNAELIEELLDSLPESLNTDASSILNDLTQTSVRISDHGERAARIVKDMLQHSRQGTGSREESDINHLLDEYVHLAYYGIRANHPDFSMDIHTAFDDTLEPILIVPQDIGRVILNIVTNGCQALMSRKNQAKDDFTPMLWLKTRQGPDYVEICIRDNGIGMSTEVQAQIFAPFFTTKPAGEGTGLGMSISHDIIVQGHQGQILVESEQGEYTEIRLTLPTVKAGILLEPELMDV